jgi:diaminohydroxyphosphoribosylaminopyrimidine deaminase/5-amino-6-(5-phosphoribosylamino)uracil reductase
MERALELALRGQGYVEPNPMVGAVMVRDGNIIAEGWHQSFGGPHAEAEALQQCLDKATDPAGADMYVTLEPCCHHGKTPPCAEALIAAKIARVFIAVQDPTEKVAGKGIEQLTQAGIKVHVGLCQEQAEQLNEPFFKHTATGLPWVIAKWAQTLDGRIATSTGDSKWISNTQSRRIVHQLRARVDAIIVGIGTVLADDPRLNARDVELRRSARAVVIDPHLKISDQSRLIQSLKEDDREQALTLAVHTSVETQFGQRVDQLRALGVEFIFLDGLSTGKMNLKPLLKHLSTNHQASNILIEGGAKLFGSMMQQQLIDQILAFIGPKILADTSAISAVGPISDTPRLQISLADQLTLRRTEKIGDDVLLDYRVR